MEFVDTYIGTCIDIYICLIQCSLYRLPWSLSSKESACNAGDVGLIHGLGRSPGEGKGYPIQYFWPGEFHGLYSALGPWGDKELNMTERLSLLLSYMNGLAVFPTFSNLSLHFAIMSWWSELQSAQDLVFACSRVSPSLASKNIINLISVLIIW